MAVNMAVYDTLVHAIYDAALHPLRWPQVLERLCAAFESRSALLFTPLHGPAQGGFTFTHCISTATVERWSAKSIHDDVYTQAAVRRGLLFDGMAVNSDDLVPRVEAYASRFYQELWKPAGLSHGCMGVVFAGTDARHLPTAISIYRGPGDAAFLPPHVEMLRALLAHLSRSLGVMYHLRDSQLQMAASLAALDRLPGGVVLLDEAGHASFINRSARALFNKGDVVVQAAGHGLAQLRLAPALRAQEPAFQSLMRRSLEPQSSTGQYFSDALVICHANGESACVIHAAPLGSAQSFGTTDGSRPSRAIVFLYSLESVAQVRPELLCELFSLTPAKDRAALQLLHGGGVTEMAERLGVSANTFKTQLRVAYEKTHTHRQADLLKLLLSLTAG